VPHTEDVPRRPDRAPADGPWLLRRPGNREVGRHVAFYVIECACWSLLTLALLGFDVFLVAIGLGFGDNDLGVSFGAGGIVAVILLGSLLGFMCVLWLVGYLSQAALSAILAGRAARAPRGSTVGRLIGPIARPTVDAVVQTPSTIRWNVIGNIGWLPSPPTLVGGVLIGIGLALMSAVPEWRLDGADVPTMYGVVIACAVLGAGGITWGVRRRIARYRAAKAAASA
jgi:hypothetical protein